MTKKNVTQEELQALNDRIGVAIVEQYSVISEMKHLIEDPEHKELKAELEKARKERDQAKADLEKFKDMEMRSKDKIFHMEVPILNLERCVEIWGDTSGSSVESDLYLTNLIINHASEIGQIYRGELEEDSAEDTKQAA
ncbi:MAG: hypothetical protein KAJ29_04690 [Alphaproteobacteria bacterium]|nr:hypothetical protein [Alphaproteobacteria bacterium]